MTSTASGNTRGLDASRRSPPRIVPRGRRLLEKTRRMVRRLWLPVLIAAVIAWASLDSGNLNALLLVLGFVGRLLFAILFVIIQFGAIFWFISRTRTVIIRPEDPKSVTFDDYWGQPALLSIVKQWISLLSDRDKFVKMGGQYINGLLLYGEPGTGKTLLAKAMAGEAGVAFVSVEGSAFRGMFWGMDTLRVMQFVGKARSLAREYGACIAYIDEIDAIGQSRGSVMGGGGPMPMPGGMGGFGGMNGALTRLLYEMDGVGEPSRLEKLMARVYRLMRLAPPQRNWHVLFMGSTNRPDVLDPALLRPGRFDQILQVDRPDRVGRREVIEGYLSKIRHDPAEIDIDGIVADTPRATPAQLMAAITKDAVRRALFAGRERVIQEDIDQAIQEQMVGMANPVREMDPLQLRQVAFHESGHAVIQHYVMPDQRISRVSIVRRARGIMGYVLPVDTVEIYGQPLRRIVADIMVALAGHVCVKLFLGEYWTGAYSDYQQARSNFRHLAMLGYFGPPVAELGVDVKDLRFSDQRVENIWLRLEEQIEALLVAHADEVEALVEALLEKYELSNAEVLQMLGKNSLQLAVDQGQELESVLEQLGVNRAGLAFKRQAQQALDEPHKPTDEPATPAGG